MAKEGMFFTHFYSPQAVCTASRAGYGKTIIVFKSKNKNQRCL
jgi:hypothetical protein